MEPSDLEPGSSQVSPDRSPLRARCERRADEPLMFGTLVAFYAFRALKCDHSEHARCQSKSRSRSGAERQRLRKRRLTYWKLSHKKAKSITSVGPLRKGPKTALNALSNLCFNKLQCKAGRTRDLRDSKAGSVAVSQLLLTQLENALNARLPSRSTKVQRKQAPTRKPQSSHSGSICQRLERCTRSVLDAYQTTRST
ncbi:hypothetical protein MTO96_000008 [Rhipicephalus appendiculatus]